MRPSTERSSGADRAAEPGDRRVRWSTGRTRRPSVSHILTKLALSNRTQIALLAHDADLV
jgi:hypothetical protein